MDCTNEKECTIIPKKYNIQGYPTVLYIKDNMSEGILYEGDREPTDFKKWVENVQNPSSKKGMRDMIRRHSGVKPVHIDLPDNVIMLTDTTVRPTSGPVLFYAPWCGHCTTAHPEYIKVARSKKNVTFYIVNGDRAEGDPAKKLKEMYNIKGFPSIVWLENGKRVVERDFNKPIRDKEHISVWVEENLNW